MDRNQIITIGSIVLLVVAGFLLFRPLGGGEGSYGDNNANFPDGFWFICGDEACGHEFHMTVKQFDAFMAENYGKPITKPSCPKCGKAPAMSAYHCKACEKTLPLVQNTVKCAECGTPLGAK